MEYPYIGKLEHDSRFIALFLSSNLACNLQSPHGDWEGAKPHEYVDGWCEGSFKNITTEYLANTYGEVKSKEHAEFIKLLAETNKVPCAVLSIDMNYTMFYVIDGCLFFCVEGIDAVGDYKKITIPLPPESNVNTPEEDFEMQQIAKNNDIKPSRVTFNTPENLNLSFTTTETISTSGARQLDVTVIDNAVYDYDDYDELPNNGDNLMFGDADKCKEWPCVGDEVLINIEFDKYDIKYGKEVNGENGVVRSIFKDGDATVYAVSVDGTCYCFVKGLLQKPKTPEEELRDQLFQCLNPKLDTLQASDLATWLIENYNITKKGK